MSYRWWVEVDYGILWWVLLFLHSCPVIDKKHTTFKTEKQASHIDQVLNLFTIKCNFASSDKRQQFINAHSVRQSKAYQSPRAIIATEAKLPF